ncbi:hypothetical protein EST38_g1820 [Candolleomyces aberdarensis]|uniref:Rab-GAP TBC domain-containing protein n=1 Tax=Candolleomyces aberdarensis TaxID=2316362 RepID=A0A4Q2DW42_9AGAR|nr:hypothetical protein EST38_g1820 [Candolleomyces aberdarensis]
MSKSPIQSPAHAIAVLSVDDDDAFADGDDDTDMSSAFTREAIRKELERHLPPPLEPSWEEVDSEHNTASSTGAFFKDQDSNASVSTLDMNGGTYGQPGEWTSPTVESPPSAHYPQILTSAMTEVHSDSEDSPTRPASDPEEPKTPDQQDESPYPSVVIDAPTHRVTLTSEIKPYTSSVSVDGSSAAVAVATVVATTQLPTSSASTPASTSRTQVSEQPSSSSLPSSKATPLFEKPYNHKYSRSGGPTYDEAKQGISDLKDMLYAWVVARSDEGLSYIMGAARVAAMMLINLPTQNAFMVMRNLLDRHCLRSFFGGEESKDDVEAYYRIFDTLLADGMPKIYFNFKQHQLSPSAYLPDWLIPLFLNHLPFEACARLWDVLLLEGDSFLFRAAIGILAVLEPRLFFPDRKELLDLLKGENKAALEVAKREGASLDGGKYEIYGVDEETLWDRIDHMEDWWKESTWTRLIQRELPDI